MKKEEEKTNLIRFIDRSPWRRRGPNGTELSHGPPENYLQVGGIGLAAQTLDPLGIPVLLSRQRGQSLFGLRNRGIVVVSELKKILRLILGLPRLLLRRGGNLVLNKRKLEKT